MKKITYIISLFVITSCGDAGSGGGNTAGADTLQTGTNASEQSYQEPHRPQIHFSPKKGWMNDPNGMVFQNGTYHLFFQYNPDSTVWGPMHWGHATSSDLVHWQEQAIALYPDSLGTIFSGSAVVDVNNTAGFGKNGQPPLVAIFTHHNAAGEKTGRTDFQNQSLAYSLDEGKTWTKYSSNPVVKNPGIKDFRDPKVSWFEPGRKWIMTLATLDRITFYTSPNLKDWKKESEFGKTLGAHGGVWECPDLFALDYKGQKVWVLIVNINPGGPNGGSATQYFTGQFDGSTFKPDETATKWLDYGPDEYAGITWSNTEGRRIFLGWMSNWQYANRVPTGVWRSAMTIPRELALEKYNNKYLVTSSPVRELTHLNGQTKAVTGIAAASYDLTANIGNLAGPARIDFTSSALKPFTLTLSNKAGDKLLVGYDKGGNNYFIDRSNSGDVAFEKGFAARHTAPRFSSADSVDITLVIDNASVELFADHGRTVMTEIFFPKTPFTNVHIIADNDFQINSLHYNSLKSTWK